MTEPASLLYLYGVVPATAPAPAAELRGVEAQPVRLVHEGELAGIVSEAPADVYAEEALDARLADLAWVGERGVAHERVLSWFADRGPVLPLAPFSLHQDEARVRARLREGAQELGRTLARLAGRREWGIKLWRIDAALAGQLDELSPRLRALAEEIRAAPPGRRFLLTKKRDAARTDELRAVTAEIGRRVFRHLAEHADDALVLPLPAQAGANGRTLTLHAAFLVADERFDAFQQRVSQLAAEYRPRGFEWEFTGPWPAYHFAGR